MASVASCFELAGHQVTDELVEEIWNGHGSSMIFPGGWSLAIDRYTSGKKRELRVSIRLDLGDQVPEHSRWVGYMYKEFPVSRQGLVDMCHHMRKCRQQIQRGICKDCEGEPRPKRLRMSTGQCAMCFFRAAAE